MSGAKTRDILSQFLVESVTLSVLGGIAGIAVGPCASALISHFAKWSTLSASSIPLAFVFSALVGVSLGFYPARKDIQLKREIPTEETRPTAAR